MACRSSGGLASPAEASVVHCSADHVPATAAKHWSDADTVNTPDRLSVCLSGHNTLATGKTRALCNEILGKLYVDAICVCNVKNFGEKKSACRSLPMRVQNTDAKC